VTGPMSVPMGISHLLQRPLSAAEHGEGPSVWTVRRAMATAAQWWVKEDEQAVSQARSAAGAEVITGVMAQSSQPATIPSPACLTGQPSRHDGETQR
jgi:hypothetical protein